MPTFNQLVRKGREGGREKIHSSGSLKGTTPKARCYRSELSAKTWCLYCNQNTDPEEAELCAS